MNRTPVFPIWVLRGVVHQPHVEVGGEDKGEEGDRGPAHQVQDGPEVGQSLRDEQKEEDGDGTEHHALPVESCNKKRQAILLFKGQKYDDF